MCDEYNPSDSLNTISDTSLLLSELDSPESSCSLVFRDGEWQMPLDEDDMSYQSFNPKRASSPLPLNKIGFKFYIVILKLISWVYQMMLLKYLIMM